MEDAERERIAAVVADPEADAPRLAYAQWLEGQGQTDRARLIHVQCEREQLAAEEAELILRHGKEWGEPLRKLGVQQWTFRRGFPEDIRLNGRVYLENLSELNALTPVTRLGLSGLDDAVLSQCAASPSLQQLVAFDVGNPDGGYGISGLEALVRSPHLGKLRELSVHMKEIGRLGIEALAGAPFLKRLTHLSVECHDDENRRLSPKLLEAINPHVIQEFRWNDDVLRADSLVFEYARGDRGRGRTPERS